MKLQIINRDLVGMPQQEEIERVSQEINKLKDNKLDAYMSSVDHIINNHEEFEGIIIKPVRRSTSIRVEVIATEHNEKDDKPYNQEIGYINIEEPFYYIKGEKDKVNIKFAFQSVDSNYDWKITDTTILRSGFDTMFNLINALQGEVAFFTKKLAEYEDAVQVLYVKRRDLSKELESLRTSALHQNYNACIDALKNGLDLRAYLPTDKINARLYVNSRKEIYGVRFKAIKVNAKSMALEYQVQDKVYDYERNEYTNEFKLSDPIEVRAKKEDFLDDLLSFIRHNVKDESKQDTVE